MSVPLSLAALLLLLLARTTSAIGTSAASSSPSPSPSTSTSTTSISIEDFGAVAGDASRALENSEALAAGAARAAELGVPLVVPAAKKFFVFGTYISEVENLVLSIDGIIEGVPDFEKWPITEACHGHYCPMLGFYKCRNVTVTSSAPSWDAGGIIDGRGYEWWWSEILQTLPCQRPKIMHWKYTTGIVIEKLHLRNSPFWNIDLDDVSNVVVRHVQVETDLDSQRKMMRKHGRTSHIKDLLSLDRTPDAALKAKLDQSQSTVNWRDWLARTLIDLHVPTFPLNTDGIDVKGTNIHIHDCKIRNFDDIVVPKPCDTNCKLGNCTQDILVENIEAQGVGLSIGSVSPSPRHNCVKNVTFRNIKLSYPAKGVYIKSDPGDRGSGEISSIRFENINIFRPLWWSVWIGPQQQHQPGWNWTEHEECALDFPLGSSKGHCMAQKLVEISDIYLKDVAIDTPLLSPGVIRCNETSYVDPSHPSCRRIFFDNVTVTGESTNLPFGREYACWNVDQSEGHSSSPVPNCFGTVE